MAAGLEPEEGLQGSAHFSPQGNKQTRGFLLQHSQHWKPHSLSRFRNVQTIVDHPCLEVQPGTLKEHSWVRCSGKAAPAHAPEPRGPPAPSRLPTAHPHARCSRGPRRRPADPPASASGAAPPSAGRDVSISGSSTQPCRTPWAPTGLCLHAACPPAPARLPPGALLTSSCPHGTGRPEGPPLSPAPPRGLRHVHCPVSSCPPSPCALG